MSDLSHLDSYYLGGPATPMSQAETEEKKAWEADYARRTTPPQEPLNEKRGQEALRLARNAVRLIRDAVGFALAERNIPREPQWTLLVPQHLDEIEAGFDATDALLQAALKSAHDAEEIGDELRRELQEARQRLKDCYDAGTFSVNERQEKLEAAEEELGRLRGIIDAALRELARASDVRASRTDIIGDTALILQSAALPAKVQP